MPAVVDLAAMRDAVVRLGGSADDINPLSPAELVIDHSVQVDNYGAANALDLNNIIEFQRNRERYSFLRWGQSAFDNFRVVPPNTGIVHQVNLEYLSRVVFDADRGGMRSAYPDTVVGTDSHTTMINGLGVLGWGVGGIEAEAAMLGQPITMLIPNVVGFKLTGKLREGTTATDLVLTVTEMLRNKGVVGKFVEFFGDGLAHMPLADRATLGNMSPEFGSTCAIFPIDGETIRYLELSGRDASQCALIEAYAKAQGLWRHDGEPDALYSDTLELDMATVEPSIAGPKRPQDRIALSTAATRYERILADAAATRGDGGKATATIDGDDVEINDGDILIAAITSCTNTSNPAVMIAAGLLARNAREKGLTTKPWVKTSLAPGSKVVTDYLEKSELDDDLDAIGFYTVGYGCTTCIGNSGPLLPEIADAVTRGKIIGTSVLSGNRNFEGRIHPLVQHNFLASPPLVVAYALAGNMNVDLLNDSLGDDADGNPVYLKDIWPEQAEIQAAIGSNIDSAMFKNSYESVFEGDANWKKIDSPEGNIYSWDPASTYVKNPPYFEGMTKDAAPVEDISGARVLALLGDLSHHRPYFARRQHRQGQPGRRLPQGQRREAGRFQFLRVASRQSRGHDARHLRQYSLAQPAGPRHRRRLDASPAERRRDVDLRCRDALQGRRHAVDRAGRQRVRHGFVARLGRQGHPAAGRQGGDRDELRAHSSLEPDRHGCPAAAVPGTARMRSRWA